jgi:hypothetical protein
VIHQSPQKSAIIGRQSLGMHGDRWRANRLLILRARGNAKTCATAFAGCCLLHLSVATALQRRAGRNFQLDHCRWQISIGSSLLSQTTRESPEGFLQAVPVGWVACSSILETPPTGNSVCCYAFFSDEGRNPALSGGSFPTPPALDACAFI